MGLAGKDVWRCFYSKVAMRKRPPSPVTLGVELSINAAAHDPPTFRRFGDKIMRYLSI
jgi:hypothetical protein